MTRPAGSQLKLTWQNIGNHVDGDNFECELTLTNHSATALSGNDWAIYFSFCRKVHPDSVTGGVGIKHINGDLWQLTPTADFGTLEPGASRKITYRGMFWVIQNTDAPLGFYIVYDDGTPAAHASAIGDPEIIAFTRPEQRNRNLNDKVTPVTAASRFDDNAMLSLLPTAQTGLITPKPLSLTKGHGEFLIDAATLIVHSDDLAAEAAFLQQSLADLGVRPSRAAAGAGITLQIGSVEVKGHTGAAEEAYRLEVTSAGISITGASAAGVFNGIQSLRQLLPVSAWVNPAPTLAVPAVIVVDAPRFAYRGMHIDVGRNFSSKETVLRLLEVMALYKLNKFHFHITDDEGWRIEIPTLPELTEIGSRRGFTLDETDQVVPSFGSGAVAEGSHGTGFYTRADFIEILRFATDRHIEVIPEIDVPGHARAAIKAMNTRHQRLLAQGRVNEAEEYLLADFDDESKYESVQLWHDNVICIGRESAYRFIETVVSDLHAMFEEAGAPFKALHTGGDEIPHGAWEGSPICKAFMAEQGFETIQQLQDYFLGRFRDVLQRHGLAVAGWEEIALIKEQQADGSHKLAPNPKFTDANFRPYIWNNVWGWGQEDIAYQLANAGYKVVLSNVTDLYFDLAYAKDPEEPGYYWGGFIETRKPFWFCPLDIYTTATTNLFGHDLDRKQLDAMARLTDTGTQNVLGIQGQLWGENARNAGRVEYLACPRIIALAERAWAADPGWTFIADAAARNDKMNADWNEFANRLGQRDLVRLDGFLGGYGYRIPLPGAKLDGGKLHANVSAPGLTVRYTTDGSEPTVFSAIYGEPVAVKGEIKLATFNSTGRKSRTVTV
ncbi:family 20 glycosylhydrolase [Silvimonas sp. JCM 19000]